MWEGGGGQDGVECGGEWDNCNSIINKYIKKKEVQHSKKKSSEGWAIGVTWHRHGCLDLLLSSSVAVGN